MMFDKEQAESATRQLIAAIGEDPSREGLVCTPARVARAWQELTGGYALDPATVLNTSDGSKGFNDGTVDQMVVVAGIEFTSLCEHHMLPFVGTADVGYLPNQDRPVIVGASKLPRLVDMFARRLQVQERMTQQIADALDRHLSPLGVGVRIRAQHLCMACRGVSKRAPMATEVLLGRFRDSEVRAEFWSLSSFAMGAK